MNIQPADLLESTREIFIYLENTTLFIKEGSIIMVLGYSRVINKNEDFHKYTFLYNGRIGHFIVTRLINQSEFIFYKPTTTDL